MTVSGWHRGSSPDTGNIPRCAMGICPMMDAIETTCPEPVASMSGSSACKVQKWDKTLIPKIL